MYVNLYKQAADAMEANGGKLSYKPTTTKGPKAAVVNTTGYWGNKKKTVAKMKEYIEEAHEKGVEMLVFPETVLSGYGYLTPDKDPFYQKYGVAMQVATAETIPGKTTNELSKLAQEYNMYILFGMTEKDEKGPIYEATIHPKKQRRYTMQWQFYILMERLILIRRFTEQEMKTSGLYVEALRRL